MQPEVVIKFNNNKYKHVIEGLRKSSQPKTEITFDSLTNYPSLIYNDPSSPLTDCRDYKVARWVWTDEVSAVVLQEIRSCCIFCKLSMPEMSLAERI